VDGIGVPAVEEVQGRHRYEEAGVQFPSCLLEPASDVHHVAAEYDAAPVDAHLAEHHRSGVQGPALGRCPPDGRLEPGRDISQGTLNLEETGQRTRPLDGRERSIR